MNILAIAAFTLLFALVILIIIDTEKSAGKLNEQIGKVTSFVVMRNCTPDDSRACPLPFP
jgi:hypothetical protein